MDCRPGAITSASRSKIIFDLAPGTVRRWPMRPWAPSCGPHAMYREVMSSMINSSQGHDTRPPPETLGKKVCDRLCGAFAISGIARPSVDVYDHRLAVGPNDGVAAEDLEP